jgi:L-ascorbate metabolism protein UlaG (beta-lactamase superfamily)
MSSSVRVTYYDAAMVLIEIDGLRLLTDPVLDAAGTIVDDGPVQLVKTVDAPVTAASLGYVDAVLLSHDQHGDNLDAGGRALLAGVARVLTTPAAADRLGGSAQGLAPWESVSLHTVDGRPVTVTAVPAQHAPDELLEVTGPVTGFVIAPADQTARPIYVSGDTIRFPGLAEIARRFAPLGLALLHTGRAQVEPLGAVNLSLSAEDAGRLASELDARTVIPIHFEGWRHFTEGRAEIEPVLDAHDLSDRVRWLARGESADIDLRPA